MITFFTFFIFLLFHTLLYKWVFLKNSKNLEMLTRYCRIFINSLLFIKGEFLYKVRTKFYTMMTHILMSWFKESTERRKTSFLKESVENADLHKTVLKKKMTTQEECVKYDFVAPLMIFPIFSISLLKIRWWKECLLLKRTYLQYCYISSCCITTFAHSSFQNFLRIHM